MRGSVWGRLGGLGLLLGALPACSSFEAPGESAGAVWESRASLVGVLQTELLASDGEGADEFGASVSVSGDTAVVGAHYDDDAGNISGAAYVFARSGAAWVEEAKLVASDAAMGNELGLSVAVSGDVVFVGGLSNSAYVFDRVGASWIGWEARRERRGDGR